MNSLDGELPDEGREPIREMGGSARTNLDDELCEERWRPDEERGSPMDATDGSGSYSPVPGLDGRQNEGDQEGREEKAIGAGCARQRRDQRAWRSHGEGACSDLRLLILRKKLRDRNEARKRVRRIIQRELVFKAPYEDAQR